jgi:thiol-disulfide isomerase/thioredoxin
MINKPSWNLLFVFVLFFSCKQANSQSIRKWKVTDLQEYISKSDTPTVVSFWATYCGPCIKEIPYFQEVVKQYEKKGVKLLLVSLDFKESFLTRSAVSLIKENSLRLLFGLMKQMPIISVQRWIVNGQGVMPATLFINNKKGHRSFFEEEMSKDKFETELKKILND